MKTDVSRAAAEFERAKSERRFFIIGLEAADMNPDRARFEETVRTLVRETENSVAPDPYRDLWKAFLLKAAEYFSWEPPEVPHRRISLKPSSDEHLRQATRVISMVHELHKVGYQRIRVTPALSPSGSHWRCYITSAANLAADGFTPVIGILEDPRIASYSTSQGDRFFDWTDASGANARELAMLFLERFPTIAEQGVGRDWMYAGWLTDVLGRMEQGGDDAWLYLLADFDVDTETLERWRPPSAPPRS